MGTAERALPLVNYYGIRRLRTRPELPDTPTLSVPVTLNDSADAAHSLAELTCPQVEHSLRSITLMLLSGHDDCQFMRVSETLAIAKASKGASAHNAFCV